MNNPTTFSLICTVVEKDLERRIAKLGNDGAILRFDGLRADCLTAIVNRLSKSTFSKDIWFQIPRTLVVEADIEAPSTLTDFNAAYVRNATPPTGKKLVLTANNTSDSSIDTLKMVPGIDATTICSLDGWLEDIHPYLDKLPKGHTESLMKGLIKSVCPELVDLESFVLALHDSLERGEKITTAINNALPKIGLPKSQNEIAKFFRAKRADFRNWITYFSKTCADRYDLFSPKARPSDKLSDDLKKNLESIVKKDPDFVANPAYTAYVETVNDPEEKPFTNLLNFEWEKDSLRDFLTGVKAVKAKGLAEQTRNFFLNERHDLYVESPSRVQVDLEDFLNQLEDFEKSKSKDVPPEYVEFYYQYQEDIKGSKNNPQLCKLWDKLIHNDKIICQDFVSGLLIAVTRLLRQESVDDIKNYKIRITIRQSFTSLTDNINTHALNYFRLMNKGFAAYSDIFEWHFTRTKSKYNPLFTENPDKSETKCDSLAKNALLLQFYVGLIPRNATAQTKAIGDISVEWIFPKSSIAFTLSDDIVKLQKNKRNLGQIILANSNRTTNNKGAIGTVTLDNPTMLGTDRKGHLCSNLSASQFFDLLKRFNEECQTANLKTDHPLRKAWETFFVAYYDALQGFCADGLTSAAIDTSLTAYCDLLRALNTLPETSLIRKPFYSLVVSIGVYSFLDVSNSYAVVPPWNPMRLYSLKCRFVSRLALIRQMMNNQDANLAEKSVFFDHLLDPHPEYFDPQVVAMPANFDVNYGDGNIFHADWQLLKGVQSAFGYTLYNIPCQERNDKRQQIGSSNASVKSAKDAIATYLKLFPHEKDNFAIALPDVVSADLPIKLAKAIYDEYLTNDGNSDIPEARFTLKVGRFTANNNDCQLFEDLSGDSADTPQLRNVALMCDSIGSALRIQVETDSQAQTNQRTCNIALVDRLLSENAELKWPSIALQEYDPMNILEMPELQNRRYFDYKNPDKAQTFIVTPIQTKVGALYIRSLASNLKGVDNNDHDPDSSTIKLPALYLSTSNTSLNARLAQVHAMADWVLICNDLIDKRQLLERNIKVVRYKTDRKNNRTEIISSSLPIDVLSNHLRSVLEPVMPYQGNIDQITESLIQSSYEISGFIALRAARQDRNARELAGVTLSRHLTQNHIDHLLAMRNETPLIKATYLLDDYCSWFELLDLDSLADLLMLVISKDETGKIHLHIYVTEAKFVTEGIRTDEAKKSAQQLIKTVDHIVKIFKKDSVLTYDCPIWLNRIGDLIQDSPTEFHVAENLPIGEATEIIKELSTVVRLGNVDITVNGFSHVFSYDWDNHRSDSRESLDTDHRCYQEIYGTEAIRSILNYLDKDNPKPIFETVEPDDFSLVDTPRTKSEQKELTQPLSPTVETSPKTTSNKQTPVIVYPDKEKVATSTQEQPVETEAKEKVSVPPIFDEVITDITEHQRYAPAFEALVNAKADDNGYSAERCQWADQASRALRMKLQQKNIRAVEIDHVVTPNGCLVRFEGDDTLTTKAIKALEENLLTTASLKVIFATPALGEFQILLEGPKREAISMWSIWKRREVTRNSAGINLSFAIGLKEIDNAILYLNPIKQDPHTLIAGGTGSGKTVLVQMLLLDIAATNPSSRMKFYLIDPKKSVDYTAFKQLPHLAAPQICEKEDAEILLQELLAEMNRRLELFESIGAKNLERYNAKVSEDKRLPVLWLIHDEFSAWMVDKNYAEMIEETLTVLTVQARATGIYLILIAQRPDKDVMPMQIRDNLGNRLALKLPTEQSSVIALGNKGAEVLLGKGHLAAKLNNEIVYAQVPFLNEENDEIEDAIQHIIECDAQWR